MIDVIVLVAVAWLVASVVTAIVAGHLLRAGSAADEVIDLRTRPSPGVPEGGPARVDPRSSRPQARG